MIVKRIFYILSILILTACNQQKTTKLDTSSKNYFVPQKSKDSIYTTDKGLNTYLNVIVRLNSMLTPKEKEILKLVESIPRVKKIMKKEKGFGECVNLRIIKEAKNEYKVWGEEYGVACNSILFMFHVNPETMEIKNYDMVTGEHISLEEWKNDLK